MKNIIKAVCADGRAIYAENSGRDNGRAWLASTPEAELVEIDYADGMAGVYAGLRALAEERGGWVGTYRLRVDGITWKRIATWRSHQLEVG